MPIGVSPLSWSNDDLPALGDEIALETCLAEAAALGYEGIELGRKFPRRAAALRPILRRHRLELISGWYSARLLERDSRSEIAALSDHLSLLTAMGCQVMVFAEVSGSVHGTIETPLSQRPHLGKSEWRRLGDRLNEVGAHLRENGLRLAYHHHMGTVVESESDIDRLMESTDETVGLVLDSGHLAYAGADAEKLARKHANRLIHVHCKDVRGAVLNQVKNADSSFLEAVLAGVFTVPGDGAVDFGRFANALAETDYGGWLVVEAEQDPAKAPPLTYAGMGLKHLREMARKAGLPLASASGSPGGSGTSDNA